MKYFALSDIGKIRKENQDTWRALLNEEDSSCALVVCDGMGGANAGSTASALAAESFIEHAQTCLMQTARSAADVIASDAAAYANIRLYDRAFTDSDCRGMGTTLVAAVVLGSSAAVVNIGDSRAYLFNSRGELSRITRDHSLVAEMLARGKITKEEAENHPRKNVITRALGMDSSVKSDVFVLSLERSDRLLLCTDGLSNQVSETEIALILQAVRDPEDCCNKLLDIALERGAPDNVTVAVLCME